MSSRRTPRSRGFTLVELLVVIAIIGVLVGLLLPAVQAAREAARRISCANNLKQLGLAIQNYHDINNCIPTSFGGNNSFNSMGNGKSWMVAILPQIEQQPLYDQIDWTLPIGDNSAPATTNVNTKVADTVIKAFLCPSDGSNDGGRMSGLAEVGGTHGVNNYKACAGNNWGWGDHPHNPPIGPYMSNNGMDQGNGLICRNAGNPGQQSGYFRTLASVTDGTSNTFAVGEAVPRWCRSTWWWWFNGTTATAAIPLNYKPTVVTSGSKTMDANWGDWPNNYSFMSRHPGGGQFCLVDASVRFVSQNVDLTVYRNAASIMGGEPTQLD